MKETIYGNVPSKSNSYRIIKKNGKSSIGKTAELRQYEKDFYKQCVRYRHRLIGCSIVKNKVVQNEVGFKAVVYYSSKKA